MKNKMIDLLRSYKFVKDAETANTSYTLDKGHYVLTVAFELKHQYFVEVERGGVCITLFESDDYDRLKRFLDALINEI